MSEGTHIIVLPNATNATSVTIPVTWPEGESILFDSDDPEDAARWLRGEDE